MTSLKNAVLAMSVLFILSGVLSAFNVSAYIYANEKNVAVSYSNFTIGADNYSLVALNGVDTFLLLNDLPLMNQTDIAPAIQTYYVQTYFPSSADIANLSALIKQFNDSRNSGYDFPGKGEYVCREDVIFNDKLLNYGTRAELKAYGTPINCTDPAGNTSCTSRLECRNNVSCLRLSSLVGGHYCEASNILCDSNEALGAVTNFSIASYNMDDILGNYTSLLANLGPDNVADTMSYIQASAPTLTKDAVTVQASGLRTPRLNDSVDRNQCLNSNCYGLCPSMNINLALPAQIVALATSLGNKVAPLKNYQSYATQLAAASAARIGYAKKESTAAYYADIFSGLNASGSAAIALGTRARTHVANSTLNDNLDQLIALQSTIPQDIAATNFTTMESDLADYKSSTAVVGNLSAAILGVYNDTVASKNNADMTMLLLETRDAMDPSALETFGILQNQTADLDAAFRDGYSVGQLQTLAVEYDNITASANALLNSESDVPATRAVLLFRGFARRVNVGIDKFATAADPAGVAGIAGNDMLSFGSFSTVVFLSLTALSALVFLYILTSASFDVPQSRIIVGAAFLCTLLLFLGLSVFLYLFLDKTATSATFPEFISDFSSRNSTAIVLDLQNVSYSDSQSMVSCANSLSGILSADNKTWAIYTVTPSGCMERKDRGGNLTLTADACVSSVANQSSSFYLDYSAKDQTPRFSIIYKSEADITANSDYYKSCPLVTLFG